MSETAAHYETLLARHYTWMLGANFAELVTQQRELLASCGAGSSGGQNESALDLGCGSGIHSVALAQLGYDPVFGIDLSRTLLDELAARSARFPAIRAIHADLCTGLPAVVAPRSITTAVCMGDTLPHLPDIASVRRLVHDTFDALVPGGSFILSFRDLSTQLCGLDRFIQVRADRDRIMTCFLEDEVDAVRVYDLIYTTDADGAWQLGKSSYRKLRLAPALVTDHLREAGFIVSAVEAGPDGMCVISARRPGHTGS